MDWDEAKAKTTKTLTIGEDLSSQSIAELEGRIVTLTAEIERVKAEIGRKKAHSAAAASIFKS